MGRNSFCEFADTCKLYQGKEEKIGQELVIYKNVFCHRGLNGWNNCKYYLDKKNNDKTPSSDINNSLD